jgi:uridine kinase
MGGGPVLHPARETFMPVVIGVAGGSGSGKTTVVQAIVRALGAEAVTHIEHDAYYFDRSTVPPEERLAINYDHPDALESDLLVRHLEALRAGRRADVPVYDFAAHTRRSEPRTVFPRAVVIVEGILILAEPRLRALMDVRVFVDTDPDIRFIRRLLRDTRTRGRTVDEVVQQYLSTVQPMHLEFVEPSKRHAHVIIPEGGQNQVAVDMLIAKIRSVMTAR